MRFLKITAIDHQIGRLAFPALGALIAEPLFLIADSAMVGHLGAAELGGVALAAAVLQTVIGLMIFLAYSTTPLVARRVGAGNLRGAVSAGVDGLWLAVVIGLVVATLSAVFAQPVISLFTPTPAVAETASTYLTVSLFGIPAMLLVYAATGLLRGLQNTVTPLWVSGIGFAVNIGLNYVFIYVFGWGVAGSALGTVLVQWGMVAVYLIVVHQLVKETRVSWRPHLPGIIAGATIGGWLFVRTLSLRAAMLTTVFVATHLGTSELASFHVSFTLFSTAAFALDSIAIAAQALVGKTLGEQDIGLTRRMVNRCVYWGIVCGGALTLLFAALSPVLGYVFSTDAAVLAILPPSILVMSLGLSLGGYVWVLDGVLMGAADARYLAFTGVLNLAAYLPLAGAIYVWPPGGAAGVVWLTAAFMIGYIAARAVTLGLRVRGTRWLEIGNRITGTG
ncbi:MATE family efflux transporter [Lysinibacter sp. HNR]|uniref:MATE family efflux transporter n=1 Tax=Lysinibacter sp. HNR TaxID=3031408 RepID=UPI002435F011|nr:MATE family efflux transporter [Lysinibacter sp. HNR]WGD37398.1 MATE family efflux transporter [Lysinibacter sp. HNR]